MARGIRYLDRKDRIISELLKVAREGTMISYKDFGPRVGIPPQGPWRPVLDVISREQTARGLPDITFLLKNQRTRLPGQIGFMNAAKPTPRQRELAKQKLREVFDTYCPSAEVPF